MLSLKRIVLSLLCVFLMIGCRNWNSRFWFSDNPPETRRIGLGNIAMQGLSSRFIDRSSLLSSLTFSLRRRGVDPRVLDANMDRFRTSDGFLNRKGLLMLNRSYIGRYWLRGELDIRPEETLIRRTFSITISLEILDLVRGSTVAQGSLHQEELKSVNRSDIMEGLRILLSRLLSQKQTSASSSDEKVTGKNRMRP